MCCAIIAAGGENATPKRDLIAKDSKCQGQDTKCQLGKKVATMAQSVILVAGLPNATGSPRKAVCWNWVGMIHQSRQEANWSHLEIFILPFSHD